MTFQEYFNQSVIKPHIVFEFDVMFPNEQWVNIGAGIWEVDLLNAYPFVDSSLLSGFSAQSFGDIGSVTVDGLQQSLVETLLLVTSTPESFYFDSTNDILYLHIINNDEPSLHDILVGIIYGFSFDEYIPVDGASLYEGRLLDAGSITRSRDPLFFGRLSFPETSITLANGDGFFDTYANDKNLYGNACRIKLGYDGLAFTSYSVLATGFVGSVSIDEEQMQISMKDKREQLTKDITYNCINKNALDAIAEILLNAYSIPYTSVYYDTTAWATATASAPNVTIVMDTTVGDEEKEKVIDLIEQICTSVFGFFDVTPAGKYTFKFVDTSATASSTIPSLDILNEKLSIDYDPTEVISSIRVNHSKDWATTGNAYTAYDDTSRQASVFSVYKTYNYQEFNTLLITASAASALASTILDYVDEVHGKASVELPMKYYNQAVADIINVVFGRTRRVMLGSKKCEVTSVTYNLNNPTMTIAVRVI